MLGLNYFKLGIKWIYFLNLNQMMNNQLNNKLMQFKF